MKKREQESSMKDLQSRKVSLHYEKPVNHMNDLKDLPHFYTAFPISFYPEDSPIIMEDMCKSRKCIPIPIIAPDGSTSKVQFLFLGYVPNSPVRDNLKSSRGDEVDEGREGVTEDTTKFAKTPDLKSRRPSTGEDQLPDDIVQMGRKPVDTTMKMEDEGREGVTEDTTKFAKTPDLKSRRPSTGEDQLPDDIVQMGRKPVDTTMKMEDEGREGVTEDTTKFAKTPDLKSRRPSTGEDQLPDDIVQMGRKPVDTTMKMEDEGREGVTEDTTKFAKTPDLKSRRPSTGEDQLPDDIVQMGRKPVDTTMKMEDEGREGVTEDTTKFAKTPDLKSRRPSTGEDQLPDDIVQMGRKPVDTTMKMENRKRYRSRTPDTVATHNRHSHRSPTPSPCRRRCSCQIQPPEFQNENNKFLMVLHRWCFSLHLLYSF
ncbi:unnamed protein product [Schistosoma turkestanicum]|nr:unnamed protein product [Schistosoma turkestanicum]